MDLLPAEGYRVKGIYISIDACCSAAAAAVFVAVAYLPILRCWDAACCSSIRHYLAVALQHCLLAVTNRSSSAVLLLGQLSFGLSGPSTLDIGLGVLCTIRPVEEAMTGQSL